MPLFTGWMEDFPARSATHQIMHKLTPVMPDEKVIWLQNRRVWVRMSATIDFRRFIIPKSWATSPLEPSSAMDASVPNPNHWTLIASSPYLWMQRTLPACVYHRCAISPLGNSALVARQQIRWAASISPQHYWISALPSHISGPVAWQYHHF